MIEFWIPKGLQPDLKHICVHRRQSWERLGVESGNDNIPSINDEIVLSSVRDGSVYVVKEIRRFYNVTKDVGAVLRDVAVFMEKVEDDWP